MLTTPIFGPTQMYEQNTVFQEGQRVIIMHLVKSVMDHRLQVLQQNKKTM